MEKIEVFKTFCTYAKLSETDAMQYDQLVDLAIAEVTAMLRYDVEVDKYQTLLHYLCGVTVYYKYALVNRLHQSGAEIKMGDVSVKPAASDSLEPARALLADAMAAAHNVLKDNFYFAGI